MELGLSKDEVHRILKRIKKGDIEVAKDGRVIDRSKPKGIAKLQKERLKSVLGPAEEETPKQPSTVTKAVETPHSDPLEDLKNPSKIECGKCGNFFKHSFSDEVIYDLDRNGYVYVDRPTCKDYSPLDIAGWFPINHRVFIRMADMFRACHQHSRVIKVKKF